MPQTLRGETQKLLWPCGRVQDVRYSSNPCVGKRKFSQSLYEQYHHQLPEPEINT